MPRKLRPYKIEEVTDHTLGKSVVMYLNRNADPVVFYGDVFGVTVRADSAAKCDELIRAEIKKQATFEWTQIIVVSTEDHFDGPNKVVLKMSRHEISRSGEGWLQRDFHVPADDCDYDKDNPVERADLGFVNRPEMAGYYGPTLDKRGTNQVFSYSPQLWADLCAIREAITRLKERLAKVVTDPEAVRSLVQSMPSVKLLTKETETP